MGFFAFSKEGLIPILFTNKECLRNNVVTLAVSSVVYSVAAEHDGKSCFSAHCEIL